MKEFLHDVLEGLSRQRKALPPKYLYDEEGARLFERICLTSEYYVTRTELSILQESAPAISAFVDPGSWVIELGTGSARKTELLLRALARPRGYLAVELCDSYLKEATVRLEGRFPGLRVLGVQGDFTRPFELPREVPEEPRLVFFPGSTLGNFSPEEAQGLLARIRSLIGHRGTALIGVDLLKDPTVLRDAYDDLAGVTARFNRNLLARINRELGASFDLRSFRHEAIFNFLEKRMEMHLVSSRDQIVRIGTRAILFKEGESIHTESSYKYSVPSFTRLAREGGLRVVRTWTDPRRYFGVFALQRGREPVTRVRFPAASEISA